MRTRHEPFSPSSHPLRQLARILMASVLAGAFGGERPLFAATVYFDANGSSSGSGIANGSTHSWSGSMWGTSNGNGSGAAWVNGNVANFSASNNAGAAYTVTLDGNRSIAGLRLTEGNVTINTGSSGSLIMSASSTFTIDSGRTLTMNAAIGESGGIRNLTKASAGTLILAGTNTYTGTTVVSNSGGILQVGNGGTSGTLGGGSVSLGSSTTLRFNRSDSLTVANNISGSGLLSQIGAGTTILTGANTYSGGTTISSGTLQIGNGGTSGTLGTGTLTNNGALKFNRSDSISASDITGTGSVTQAGTGTLTLSGTNSYTGGTSVTAGTLAFASSGALPGGTANINVSAGATVAANYAIDQTFLGEIASASTGTVALGASSSNGLNFSTGSLTNVSLGATGDFAYSGALTPAGSTYRFGGGGGNLTVTSALTGARAVTQQAAGVTILTNANTYSGGTTISAGGLVAANNSALGTNATLATVTSGGALGLANGIILGSSASTINLAGTGYLDSGALASATAHAQQYAGNINLTANATIAANIGTLTVGTFGSYVDRWNNPFGTSPNVNTLDPTRIYLNNNTLTFSGTGTTIVHGRIDNNVSQTAGGNVTIDAAGGTVQYVNNQNTYTGDTRVNAGTLLIDTLNNSHPNDPVWTQFYGIKSNSTNLLTGTNTLYIGDGSGAAESAKVQLGTNVSPIANEVIDYRMRVNIKSDGYFFLNNQAQSIGLLEMTGGRINAGTSGTLFLNGDVTIKDYAGTATIDGGGLGLSNHNTTEANFANRQFDVQARNAANNADDATSNGDLLVNAKISFGSITKIGEGTMQITSDNSFGYAGTTTINNGVLRVTHNDALGQGGNNPNTSYTRVNNGGTLQLRGGITVADEYLYLNGNGESSLGTINNGALSNAADNNTYGGIITLESNSRIASSSGLLTITGTLGSSNNYNLTVGGTSNVTHSGTLSLGAGQLRKENGGTYTFSGTSGVAGQAHIAGGTMIVGTGSATNLSTAELTSDSGTTLTIASGATVTSVYDSGISNFNGILGSTSAGTLTLSSAADSASGLKFGASFAASDLTLKVGGSSIGGSDLNDYFKLTFGSAVQVTVGTLHITGDTILDFGGSAGTWLTSTNLIIDAGVKITVQNWFSVADNAAASTVWKVLNTSGGVQGSSGNLTLSGSDIVGGSTLNQITFANWGSYNYNNLTTTWVSGNHNGWFDREIRPTPEPATYGALFLGACFGFLGWRRWRTSRKSAAAA